jgi:hypothetical protein
MTSLNKLVRALRDAACESVPRYNIAPALSEVDEQLTEVHVTAHPLGFMHFELTSIADALAFERVRLHVWPATAMRVDPLGTVHDHTWELASAVLVGELRDHNYNAQQDDRGAYDGFRVCYGASNVFETAGRYCLKQIGERLVRAGEIYRVQPRIIHTTEIVSRPTATLVVATERPAIEPKGPLILNPVGGSAQGSPTRDTIDIASARANLRAVIDAVLP